MGPEHGNDVVEAAGAIRPYLDDLVGERAALLDDRLAALLQRATAGDAVEKDILDVLRDDPETERWAATYVQTGLPPELAAIDLQERTFGLPGNPQPSPATAYRCPNGDYIWYRRVVGQVVPECPTHHCPLQ